MTIYVSVYVFNCKVNMIMKTKELMVKPYLNEARANSRLIAEGFGISHRSVTNLIKKYNAAFLELGSLPSEKWKRKQNLVGSSTTDQKIKKNNTGNAGEQEVAYFLNEEQGTFIGTLTKNSTISVAFKLRLVKDYSKCKKLLNSIRTQQTDTEWLEKRIAGKLQRKEETDLIEEFVNYAKANGSKSSERYYGNLTKMQNAALFCVAGKFPNLRDIMDTKQLSTIGVSDKIVANSLRKGIDAKMDYHDVFSLAKADTLAFAALFGKTDIVSQMLLD